MCRLAAYRGPEIAPSALVYEGDHSLYRQSWAPREMLSGTVNADGFGVAWYHEGAPVRLVSDRPAWHTPEHRTLLESVRSGTVVASMRNATEGLGIDMASVAPLARGRWVFTLNGYVTGFRPIFMRRFREELSDERYGQLVGSSDTETLFQMLLTRIDSGADPGEALASMLAWTAEAVRSEGSTAQLNVVVADGETLWASRFGTYPESNSLYVRRGYGAGESGSALASEPLGEGDWQRIPDRSLVRLGGEGVDITPI